jgi:hypothetical protein
VDAALDSEVILKTCGDMHEQQTDAMIGDMHEPPGRTPDRRGTPRQKRRLARLAAALALALGAAHVPTGLAASDGAEPQRLPSLGEPDSGDITEGTSRDLVVRLSVPGRRDDASVVIALASDGEPIPPAVERHLFEPFFSTRSRGSGLGLYICRELCERHGASIEFRLKSPDERHRNAFVIVMRRAAGRPGAEVAES